MLDQSPNEIRNSIFFMSFTLKILSFIALLLLGCNQQKDFIQVESPNKEIAVQIRKQKNDFIYNVNFKGKRIILNSKIGLMFKNGLEFPSYHNVREVEREFHSGSWELPWGEKRVVQNIIKWLRSIKVKLRKNIMRSKD